MVTSATLPCGCRMERWQIEPCSERHRAWLQQWARHTAAVMDEHGALTEEARVLARERGVYAGRSTVIASSSKSQPEQ